MVRTDYSNDTTYSGRLKYLVYMSVAARDLSSGDVDSILTVARERNASADITGLLLFRNGTFIQFLEGSAEEIDLLMASIRRDDRHRNVRVIIEQPADQRRFSDWRMGFRVPKETDASRGGAFRDSFSDITSSPDPAVVERAAKEFSLWFRVRESSAS